MIDTPDLVDLEVPLGGPFSRGCALFVDGILMTAILMVCLLGWVALRGTSGEGELSSAALGLVLFFTFVVMWGYGVFWELAMSGQTPGKRMLGLRVIRQDGLRVGPAESALRNLCRVIDCLPFPCYLVGTIAMMCDPMGRRLGWCGCCCCCVMVWPLFRRTFSAPR